MQIYTRCIKMSIPEIIFFTVVVLDKECYTLLIKNMGFEGGNRMFVLLAGGLLIIIIAVIIAVVSSVAGAVAADADETEVN